MRFDILKALVVLIFIQYVQVSHLLISRQISINKANSESYISKDLTKTFFTATWGIRVVLLMSLIGVFCAV